MKRLFTLTLAALLAVQALAQTQEVLTFTRIDRNPRTAALAGAGAASVSNVAYASFQNAATVPFYARRADIAVGYQHWQPALGAASCFHAGGAYNFGRLGVTLGWVSQIEQPDTEGFKPSKLQLNLGAGFAITPWLSVGLNARLSRDVLFSGYALTGFNADAMVLAAPVKGLTVTAGVANLGNAIKSASGKQFPQPSSLKVAAAYAITFAEAHTVEAMMDADYYFNSRAFGVSAGVEYAFRQMVFARVGYRRASDLAAYPTHLGVGLGVQFFGVRLDVSWLTASPVLGNTLAAGLGFRF